jgi:tRNA threonylcarbamoyl adenosine modification protein (Sua5/YciO/YrdC/YwlC family)
MIIDSQPYGLHPQDKEFILDQLKQGKVGIIPTDTVYAFCCLANEKNAYAHLCKLKHVDPNNAMMSIVCRDLSHASQFFSQWDTPTYRILHAHLPGGFTFIMQSGHHAPTFLKNKRKTLGLRIPDHQVINDLMTSLDDALIVGSVTQADDIDPYFEDSAQLISQFEKQVAFILLDEHIQQEGSTVVDLTGAEPLVLRQSKHELKE